MLKLKHTKQLKNLLINISVYLYLFIYYERSKCIEKRLKEHPKRFACSIFEKSSFRFCWNICIHYIFTYMRKNQFKKEKAEKTTGQILIEASK